MLPAAAAWHIKGVYHIIIYIYIYSGGIYSVYSIYSIYSIYKWVISYNHGSWVLNGAEADMILEEIHYH